MNPAIMVWMENEMLKAARTVLGSGRRARKAWMMEWETIISSDMKIRGRKNRAASW